MSELTYVLSCKRFLFTRELINHTRRFKTYDFVHGDEDLGTNARQIAVYRKMNVRKVFKDESEQNGDCL
jgi:hypothetical protein